MFTAATKLGSRYAIPATATGGLLVLALSPTVVDAKVEVNKPIDVAPIKKASKYSAVDTIIFFLRQLLFLTVLFHYLYSRRSH